MIRIYLLVEGQTEEIFVRELLQPHYARMGLFITPIIVTTSRGHRGGVVSYTKVKPQIERLCKQDRNAIVSILFDLYALPKDFPGKTEISFAVNVNGHDKAVLLEERLASDINLANFIPYIMVHEFETLLFVQPEKFGYWADNGAAPQTLIDIRRNLQPEDINDGPNTAPSKRILAAMPNYQKTFHGPLIACDIGLNAMRAVCPHFHSWLEKLESLANR
jgi:Domain of unknown function (DUF4276)